MFAICTAAAISFVQAAAEAESSKLPTTSYEVPITAEPKVTPLDQAEPEVTVQATARPRAQGAPSQLFRDQRQSFLQQDKKAERGSQQMSVDAGAEISAEAKAARPRSARIATSTGSDLFRQDTQNLRQHEDRLIAEDGGLGQAEAPPPSLAELEAEDKAEDKAADTADQAANTTEPAANTTEPAANTTEPAASPASLDHLMGVSAHEAPHVATVEHLDGTAGHDLHVAVEHPVVPAAPQHDPHHEIALPSSIHDAGAESEHVAALVDHAASATNASLAEVEKVDGLSRATPEESKDVDAKEASLAHMETKNAQNASLVEVETKHTETKNANDASLAGMEASKNVEDASMADMESAKDVSVSDMEIPQQSKFAEDPAVFDPKEAGDFSMIELEDSEEEGNGFPTTA